MITMFQWLNHNRSDIEWLKGPFQDGTYEYDTSLPNQEEIVQLILDYDPNYVIVTVPPSVTPRQIRLALVRSGITIASIEAGIDALPEPSKSEALIAWEYSTEFQRDNPMLLALGPSLGFTSEQLDTLFIYASTL